MTKRDFVGLALKVLIAYAFVLAVVHLIMEWEAWQIMIGFTGSTGALPQRAPYWAAGSVRFALVLMGVIFFRPLSFFLGDETPLELPEPFQNLVEVQKVAFRILGAYFVFLALPALASATFEYGAYYFSAATAPFPKWPQLASALAQTALACSLLVFGSRLARPTVWGRDPQMPTALERPMREEKSESGAL